MQPERQRPRPSQKVTPPSAIPYQSGLRILLLAASALFKGDGSPQNVALSAAHFGDGKPHPESGPESDPKNFHIGPWELHFADDFPTSLRERLQEVYTRAFGEIQNLMGAPSQSGKGEWKVKTTDEFGGTEETQKRLLEIALNSTDALKVHELAHMFQGDDFPEFDWAREGIAVAISNMVAEKIGIPRWDTVIGSIPPVLGKNLQVAIGLTGGVSYDSYRPLMPLRFYLSGKFWEDLEKSHPGSIRTLTRNLHDWYRGKTKEDAEDPLEKMTLGDFFKKFLGFIPDLTSDTYINLLSPRPLYKPYPYQDLALGSFEVREGRPQLYVEAVRKFPDSHDEGHPNKPGVISFINPKTALALDVPFQTDADGAKVFELGGLKEAIGLGPFYQVHIEIEGCHAEDIEFSF